MTDMQEPIPQPPTRPAKKHLSDDTVDGLASVALILIIVAAVVYWLVSLPDTY